MKDKPEWWPEPPYPDSIFIGTEEDFKKAKVPQDAIHYLSRLVYGIAEDMIFKAYLYNLESEEKLK